MKLKCPECGAEVLRRVHADHKVIVVVFKCFFSATFDEGLSDEDMQSKLDEFKRSGKMAEWVRKPML
jgi:hypothetical protein